MTNSCNCTHAGWCCRLGMEMTDESYHRCKTDDAWREEREKQVQIQVRQQPLKDKPEPEQKRASLGQRAIAYKDALIRWVKAGRPKRTKEQIAILKKTCEECPHWNNGCKLCGCPMTTVFSSIFGMAKKWLMKTESCPDPQGDRWKVALELAEKEGRIGK